ncbi:MAG: PadR family transcriptional regulator [Anaerolineae bacterium]|nr:PadR family transcriptional regulator [Anaerolineae bacterium]
MLKFILLGFLSYRPLSGYDIEHWMRVSTGHFWHVKLSQIYTTLKKLEAEGLVRSEIEPQADRPDRRVYTLTDAGMVELDQWRSEMLVEMDSKKDTLLLKVFFASPDASQKESLLAQLRLQLDLHQKQKQRYEEETPEAIAGFIERQPELAPHSKLWDLTRRYGVLYEEGYIQWLQEAIQMIENEL